MTGSDWQRRPRLPKHHHRPAISHDHSTMQHGINRKITGFGPGNLIEKWLHAYGEGDVNRINDLNEWRNGDYGWIQTAPKA